MTNFISLEAVKAARVELLDGNGKGSKIFGSTVAESYEENADSYIDELRYPVDVIDVLLTYRADITSFLISVDGAYQLAYGIDEYLMAYDIGGEYLLVKGPFNKVAIFSIDSNI